MPDTQVWKVLLLTKNKDILLNAHGYGLENSKGSAYKFGIVDILYYTVCGQKLSPNSFYKYLEI